MSGMEREEERRGKSSGRKGMAQRAEREEEREGVHGGEEERGGSGLSTSRPPNKSEQVQGGMAVHVGSETDVRNSGKGFLGSAHS